MRLAASAARNLLFVFALLLTRLATWGAEGTNAPARSADRDYIVKTVQVEWLSDSSVIAMTQTHDGYLWLGTLNGLARFDGVKCTVFTEANTPELKSSPIVSLFEDSRSNLWVGTETAGTVMIRKNGSVLPVQLPEGRVGRLTAISEDASGTVWLNVADGLVGLCPPKETLSATNRVRPDLLQQRFNRVVAENPGRILFVSGKELDTALPATNAASYDLEPAAPVGQLDFILPSKRGGHWRLADQRVQHWMNGSVDIDLGPYPWRAPVMSACEDNDGRLVVGTKDEGLYWLHGPGDFTHVSTNRGLSQETVLSLCMDHEGVLWVGTDGGGLNSVRPRQFRVQDGSIGLTIQSVCDDLQGGVWYANFGGKLYHVATNGIDSFAEEQGLPTRSDLRCVLVDHQTNTWIGTLGAGLLRKEQGRFPQVLSGPGISVLHEDRQGRLWIGSQAGIALWDSSQGLQLGPNQKLSSVNIRAIVDDADGNIWIGTAGGGLNRLRPDRDEVEVFRKGTGIPSDTISTLFIDAEKKLWIGTAGGGLARFFEGKWTTYTTADGLSGNSISYIIEDELGFLWIGSNAGLMRVSKQELNAFADGRLQSVWCRVYLKADGLPTHECTQGSQPAACRSADGRLWFSTIRGLVSVSPGELKPNEHRPPVVIESAMVQGQEMSANPLRPGALSRVVVPPGKELLEIRYTSLNLSGADRARFRYQLEGLERGWTEAGERRVAPFSNLPHGRYVFHVIACNEDGAWNRDGARMEVIVLPPFWKTSWFLAGSALFIVGLIAVVVRYISTQKLQRELALFRQQEALERERARIARDLHDQLGANLTQVSLLGELAEADKNLPEEVEFHARQICETARETTEALDEIVWAANPSNDTLESLVTYSLKYAQEYLALAGIGHRLDVPSKVPEAVVAPEVRHNVFLAFKEAVNNIVKHSGAKSVRIRLQVEPDRFALQLDDDGRGLADPAGKPGRNGLRNMRKRMEDAGGGFEIGPSDGKGTRVRLAAPLGRK